ncbi:MAG: phosphatidylserine decarboxylase [Candidatus Omnitrophica bacterium]|nr:phosphatidylserine decarboxylase [Candidatus Omnitrophota bacterium]
MNSMKALPNLLTLMHMIVGLTALGLLFAGKPQAVPFLVLLAVALDASDGALARRLGAETRLGCVLDSTADAVSFVAVPPIFLMEIQQAAPGLFLLLSGAFYVGAGCLRLWRYVRSRLESEAPKRVFRGCPVTAAGLTAILFVGMFDDARIRAAGLVLLGVAMVSRRPYPHVSLVARRIWADIRLQVVAILYLGWLWRSPVVAAWTLMMVYVCWPMVKLDLDLDLDRGDSPRGKRTGTVPARLGAVPGRLGAVPGLPFARGTRSIIALSGCCFMAAVLGGDAVLAVYYGLIGGALAFFFRDPVRRSPAGEGLILSPADGRVTDVELTAGGPGEVRFLKVGIYLSVLDVHVNRAPMGLKVLHKEHRGGPHWDARDKRSAENEHLLYTCEAQGGARVLVKQIAGKFARRIKSYVSENQNVSVAAKLGVILFGSRVEVYLPSESRIRVKPGDRVRAGESIIGFC